jgi:hypothetical protein
MTTGPGDETADAAGRGHLRASHADREQAIGTLKAAFVAGMLAKDEFDLRVSRAFASRTCADLAVLTADLPAGLAVTQPSKPARAQGKARVVRTAVVLTAATAVYAGMWPLAFSVHRNMEGNPIPYDGKLILLSTLVYLFVLLVAGVRILAGRQDKRSDMQPPRRPARGAGGRASRRPPSAAPDRQLPPGDQGHPHTAEAAPVRRSRPLLCRRRPPTPTWPRSPPTSRPDRPQPGRRARPPGSAADRWLGLPPGRAAA